MYPGNHLVSTQTISKWGSSLAFRLPAAFVKQMRLEEGSKIELAIDGKRLVIQPVEAEIDPKAFFLAVKQSQAAHGLIRPGNVRGKEIR
jgi:antitoxin component of MazEF toxin-antitoxin module